MRRIYCRKKGCRLKAFSRGNCQKHLRADNARITRGEVTDAELVAAGERDPMKRIGRRPLKQSKKRRAS